MKSTKTNQTITWQPKLVEVKAIKPTPNNYKIKTDLGKERLNTSLKSFGLAGTVVCNTDLCLIDGNSRLIDAKERGEKKIWVSLPNRKLTPKEFTEMSAMYDFAKAGVVDEERIKGELGKVEDFYLKWGLTVPKELLDQLGSKQESIRKQSGKVEFQKDKGTQKVTPDELMVTLFYTKKEEQLFRKIEDKLRTKFKSQSTSETVLMAFKALVK